MVLDSGGQRVEDRRGGLIGRRNGGVCAGGRAGCPDALIGTEQPIPEEIDHRKIEIPVAMVYKMQLLLSSEPGEATKP